MSSTKPLPPSPPPLPPSTRKRLVSSTPDNGFFMDPEVIEIPPPVPRSFKSNKKKQVVIHEVIDVDKDEDSSDVVILDEMVNVRNKGKAVKGSSGVYSAFNAEDFLGKSTGSINKVEPSKHSTQGSHNIYNLDCDLAYEDDLSNYYLTDCMDVDEYAMLQAHFDSVDLPAGVEAEIPWFPNFSDGKKNTSQANTQSSVNGSDQYLSPWLSEPAHMSKKPASVSSSSFQTSVDLSLGGAVHSTFLYPQGSQSQELAPSQHKLNSNNPPLWKFQHYQAGGSTNGSNGSHSDSTMLPQAVNPTYWDHLGFASKKQIGAGSLMPSNIPPPIDTLYHAMVAEPSMTWLPSSSMTPKYNYNKHNLYPSFPDPVDGACITPQEVADIRKQRNVNEEEILSKFQLFKKFDTVEDFSDHHYASSGSSTKHAQKNWAKKIQEEWRMLEKDLPDTIFVRVYESRMDLLRAVIIGAEGTPYHDGLFFFDVLFPAGYPKVPPQVHYHSGGLRLNPNLYNCGKVCLSLLNTWSGSKNEKWIPGMSTMLQVLVSIQALILNQDPYFNEPGWAHHKGSPQGERLSQQYSEDIFILSLKTMTYSMRRPPKHFEDFVVGHFYQRAHDILSACKAYMNGSQVGCLVKGGLQNVNEGDKSCSHKFKDSVAGHVSVLVKEFTKLGAKDCEKFLTVPQCPNNRVDNTRRGVAIS